jgi:phospholipase/carboxylesterase
MVVMPHSSLVYRVLIPPAAPVRATVVALHGGHGNLDDVVPLAQALGSDLRIVAPEAARGVYNFRTMVAHNWYGWSHAYRPEPASFGDSLAQLERFLHDVRERTDSDVPAAPWLLGFDQGAVLALSLAAIVPDLTAGAIAICGCLPLFTDPTLLEPVASDLPLLLIGDPADPALPAADIEATAARFAALGARVTVRWVDGARGLGPAVADGAGAWLDGQCGR